MERDKITRTVEMPSHKNLGRKGWLNGGSHSVYNPILSETKWDEEEKVYFQDISLVRQVGFVSEKLLKGFTMSNSE